MNYAEAVQWLFDAVPNFQRDGGSKDYKIGLDKPAELWERLGRPGGNIPTIHIAGTNGKGSTCHMIAAGLWSLGNRVGLFSSPHLFSFRERAKIGRELVSEEFVASFISNHQILFERKGYSFFEISLMLALSWFEQERVDWIILETGMGGRLDATNICAPKICGITNIGLDHTQYLGDTKAKIAAEKGGIIKPHVPVVIGQKDAETVEVFETIAAHRQAPLLWSKEMDVWTDLPGSFQKDNVNIAGTILEYLYPNDQEIWQQGFKKVVEKTGLQGRWQVLSSRPVVICDTGHNLMAFEQIVKEILKLNWQMVHWILGMSSDKSHQEVFNLLSAIPGVHQFYWVSTESPRCLSAEVLSEKAKRSGLTGRIFSNVNEAKKQALSEANEDDVIFIGGSNFVVADLTL